MLDLNHPELQFALRAVRTAALLARQIQAELISPALTKQDLSPVTVADFATQAIVAKLLSETFPRDGIVAEEDSAVLRANENRQTLEQVAGFVRRSAPGCTTADIGNWIDHGRVDSASRFWTLDPIDGTKGFLRGDQYAIALALVVDGEVQVGVLGCPNLVDGCRPDWGGQGSLVAAQRGAGTWTTPLTNQVGFQQLFVSSQKDPAQARILRSFEPGHTNISQIDVLAERLDVQAEPLRMDSQAKYAVLAAGKGELMLRLLSPSRPDYKEKIWDQAAGSLVLEQAGGKITDLDGRSLDFRTGRSLLSNRGVLASNTWLHPVALAALQTIGA